MYGVVTFYSFFTMVPQGEFPISICMGTACYVKGGERLLDRVSEKINAKLGETSNDGLYTLAPTRCVGACSLAPVIMVDDDIYSKVTSDDIQKILDKTS